MTVYQPTIDAQSAEALRQKGVTQTRLSGSRDADLARLTGEFGTTQDLIAALEQGQAGADKATADNAGQVNAADQGQRYSDQTRAEQEQTLSQGDADLSAAIARAQATALADRQKKALDSVNTSYAGYDDNYYNDYANKLIAGQLPALQNAYQETSRKTQLSADQKGIGQSSSAARMLGQVQGNEAADEAQLAQSASDSAQTLRANMETNRTNALQQALAAAGIQQSVPVAGTSLSDILAAKSKAQGAAGASGPVLGNPTYQAGGASTPAQLTKPTFTPATPPAAGDGSGSAPGTGGDGTGNTTFNSDGRSGQLAGVDGSGNNLYAHYGAGAAAPAPNAVTVPQIKLPGATASIQDTPDLAAAGIQMPLQPPPTDIGHTMPAPLGKQVPLQEAPALDIAGALQKKTQIAPLGAGAF